MKKKQRFTVHVIEKREYSVTYYVEAEDKQDAEKKALEGDTIHESKATLETVSEREVQGVLRA